MKEHYDYLIVGSGLFGATFAYKAGRRGKSCLVIDRRSHLGGNVYCEDWNGINVHYYGPHIFHTNDAYIWSFVKNLIPLYPFTLQTLAKSKDQLFNLPFNMNTFYQMWGVKTPLEARAVIDRQRWEARVSMKEAGCLEPQNLEQQALCMVGRDIYERLIKGYTEKQWGKPCCELPASIINRIPVRFTFDNNYFNDRWQGIPVGGYNPLIGKLLQHADTEQYADFFEDRSYWEGKADKIVYTGPLDRYFDYDAGRLEWRSLRFEHVLLDVANHQGNAIINYTDRDIPYTRIVEHKHFDSLNLQLLDMPTTVVTREFPLECKPDNEPFYPINNARNMERATIYKQMQAKEKNVIFGGRLADYAYYDMDQVIARALNVKL